MKNKKDIEKRKEIMKIFMGEALAVDSKQRKMFEGWTDQILKILFKELSSQRKELIEEIENHIRGLIEVDKILKTKGEEYEVVLDYLSKLKKAGEQ